MSRESFVAALMVVLGVLLFLRHRQASKRAAHDHHGLVEEGHSSTVADPPVSHEPDIISQGADLAERFYRWWNVLGAVIVVLALSYLALTDIMTAAVLACTVVLMVIIILVASFVRDRAKHTGQPMS